MTQAFLWVVSGYLSIPLSHTTMMGASSTMALTKAIRPISTEGGCTRWS